MEKNNIKALVQKVKVGADDGTKKIGSAAHRAVSGVKEGLDFAKEQRNKAALAKESLKHLQSGIKDLEEENKVKANGGVQEETQAIIEQLKDLYQKIKSDPENCIEAIETLVTKYRAEKEGLIEKDLLKMQVMTKRYDEALKACISAKEALVAELGALAGESTEKKDQ